MKTGRVTEAAGRIETVVRPRARRRVGALAVGAVLASVLALAAPGAVPAASAATTKTRQITFEYTGGPRSFTVPPGVTELTVDVDGAAGGDRGGLGGHATATIAATPGTTYQLFVGGKGEDGRWYPGVRSLGGGGWNGGATGGDSLGANTGAGGGGASDVRVGGATLADRIIVAGGGGGGALWSSASGGAGGGVTGARGDDASGYSYSTGGGGGTASAGGAGGYSWQQDQTGGSGAVGVGGAGAGGLYDDFGGGGGGGGWYGGGGGGSCWSDEESGGNCRGTGGGGGSGYGPAGTVFESGVRAGHGRIVVSYVDAGISLTVSLTASPRLVLIDESATYTARVVPPAWSPAGAPTGTVTFADGGTTVPGCDAVAVSDSRAWCAVTMHADDLGTHSIVATYNGDDDYLTATSPPTFEEVFRDRATFSATGATQTWTVPPGVTAAAFELQGGRGGSAACGTLGGLGGAARASMPVTPGDAYTVVVGGAGNPSGAAAYNGGGAGGAKGPYGFCSALGASGGGATDLRHGGTALSDRVLVAGGGGGAGGNRETTPNGGSGGGLAPLAGSGVDGGAPASATGPGGNGSLGSGGAGAYGLLGGGGGGGGGYDGGGGGSTGGGGGGGGGGSGFGPDGAELTTGENDGSGVARIYFDRLAVTATVGATQTYGSSSTYTVTYSGFAAGDDESSITGSLSCTSVTPSLAVGTHDLAGCSGLHSPDYGIQYELGTIVVAAAPLTATVTGEWVTPGEAAPTYTATFTGLRNGEGAGVIGGKLSCTTTATADSPPSTDYEIIGCSGLSATNYAITYDPGALRKQARLTVSVAATQTYGGTAVYTPTFTGFVNGDTASVATGSVSCASVDATLAVGTQALSGCGGLHVPAIYAIEYAGQLVVGRAPLSATVTGSWPDLAAAPTLTAAYSGFRNGEGAGVVTGTLECTTDATATSPPGVYAISDCTGLDATNYAITFVYGGLQVDPPTQTVTFTATGAPQAWTVPLGVTSITFDVYGAAGGRGSVSAETGLFQPGGRGGRATSTIAVTPGEVLVLDVGHVGGDGSGTVGGSGGRNGGGSGSVESEGGGGGGGGASDVRRGAGLDDRLVVAGGGGGGAAADHAVWGYPGGGGGGLNGERTAWEIYGGGGGQIAGGGGGFYAWGVAYSGAPGTFGSGGSGAVGAGGGGGGWYGGGGGGRLDYYGDLYLGSGGGGSGRGPDGTSFVTGANDGDGRIVLSFTGVHLGVLTATVTGTQPSGGAPQYDVGYTGFVNGDDASTVTGALSCSTDATATSPAGSGYEVTGCSGLSSPLYDIVYVSGGLTVTPPVAPEVTEVTGPAAPVALGSPAVVSGAFTSGGGTHTCIIDWGDDRTSSTGTVAPGACAGTYTYTAPGVYEVTLTVTDADGDADAATLQYVVLYDPAGGFVTGFGWINSPAGAYAADAGAAGRATFGFVSKYRKGATVPDGTTQFQFAAVGLAFESTGYEWLVISGPMAQYKGSGAVNGTSGYGFLLTAGDGQLKGGGGTDTMRLKIWNTTTGVVIYDNQAGAADTAAPTLAVGAGNIMIHKAAR